MLRRGRRESGNREHTRRENDKAVRGEGGEEAFAVGTMLLKACLSNVAVSSAIGTKGDMRKG